MLHQLIKKLDEATGKIPSASAHCDIPCGIYDTAPALIAAVSVVRMMDLIHEGNEKFSDPAGLHNFLSRCVALKEKEAEKVKHEVRIIWGDYFKAPHLEQHPNIHDVTHAIMQKASACKQEVHREDGEALVELVNQFAEIFWATKGKETKRVTAPYAPALPMVQPILD